MSRHRTGGPKSGRVGKTSGRLEVESLERRILLNSPTALPNLEVVIESHGVTADELALLKEHFGVSSGEEEYCPVIDGHGTGLRMPTEEEWEQMVGVLRVVDDVELQGALGQPPALDWTATQYFPPIGNQGGEGSCTAWSIAYYTKTFQEALEHGWDLSTVSWTEGFLGRPDTQLDHIFSPDFIYHQINGGGDHGSSFVAAVRVIDWIGASTWSTMPYDDTDSTSWPDEAAWREAPIYRGDEDGLFVLDVSGSVDAVKALLAGGNLVPIAIDASDMTEVATLDNFFNASINHANTIVGYDDDFSYVEEGETRYGAFKVANSWGETWAGDGCWWISYEALKQRVGYVYYFEDRTGYNPELLAVFGIVHADRGDTEVSFGMGPTGSPLVTTDFISPGMSSNGDDPYPSNLMALDLTDFSSSFTVPENFFMRVFDGAGAATGTITSFAVEHYTDYINGVMDMMNISVDPPVSTVQSDVVYVQTILGGVPGIDLVPVAIELSSNDLSGLSSVPMAYTICNIGDTGFSQDFQVDFYLSDDTTLVVADDHFVGSDVVTGGMGAFSTYSDTVVLDDIPVGDPFGGDDDYYLLMSVDSNDDVAEVDEGNNDYSTSVSWEPSILFYDDFSTDTGWSGYQGDRWERGPAQAGGGTAHGNPDPGYDSTLTDDNYVLGYNIGGDYENNMFSTRWITSPVVDCSDVTGVTLQFQRWLNVEDSWWDHAYLEAYDGSGWHTVFENVGEITDSGWTPLQYDVSTYADGNSNFRVRFGMGPTDSSWEYSGWNIDDVFVMGDLPLDSVPPQVSNLEILPGAAGLTASIEVYFNEGMALYPLSELSNYSLVDSVGDPLPIASLDAGLDSVVLEIGAPLVPGEQYTLTVVSGGLVDHAGNKLDGDRNGVGGDNFERSFVLPGLYAGQMRAYGALITFYDTDAASLGEIDVRPVARVSGNPLLGITQVVLKPQYSPFGVVIQQRPGSDQPVAIRDRTSFPHPITYIVADCDVSTLALRSNLEGLDLNGANVGDGLSLDWDIDGDGDLNDLTGFVALGNVGLIQSNAVLGSDVFVSGDANQMEFQGPYASVEGDVTVGGNLDELVMASGDFKGNLTVGGSLGRLDLGSTTDLNGNLSAGEMGTLLFNGPNGVVGQINSGGDIDLLRSSHPISGSIWAGGDVGRIVVRGPGSPAVTGDISIEGNLDLLRVLNGDLAGDVSVGGDLARVVVRGDVTGAKIDVGGSLTRMAVEFDLLGSDVEVGDALTTLRVLGNYTDTDVNAQSLSRVRVNGTVSSLVGPDNEIHAGLGSFDLWVGGVYFNINDVAGEWFDGVHAHVG